MLCQLEHHPSFSLFMTTLSPLTSSMILAQGELASFVPGRVVKLIANGPPLIRISGHASFRAGPAGGYGTDA